MKNSRRNIPDPFSPQNPLNKTDITPDRVRDHLDDKNSLEEEIFRDENNLAIDREKHFKRIQKEERTGKKGKTKGEESGL